MLSSNIETLILIGTLLMLFVMSCLILFIVFHQKKIFKIESEKQLAEKAHQLNVAEAAIKSQENERKSIAEDLHDDIAPNLASAKLFLRASMSQKISQEIENKQMAVSIIDESIEKIRQLSHLLHPAEIERFGFFRALNSFALKLNKTEQVELNIQIHDEMITLESFSQLALYRIIQELIINAIKHADAKIFNLNYSYIENHIQINLMHNGKAFKSADFNQSIENPNGIGLMNILNRIKLLNSSINFDYVDSYEKHGIQILIPILQNNMFLN